MVPNWIGSSLLCCKYFYQSLQFEDNSLLSSSLGGPWKIKDHRTALPSLTFISQWEKKKKKKIQAKGLWEQELLTLINDGITLRLPSVLVVVAAVFFYLRLVLTKVFRLLPSHFLLVDLVLHYLMFCSLTILQWFQWDWQLFLAGYLDLLTSSLNNVLVN